MYCTLYIVPALQRIHRRKLKANDLSPPCPSSVFLCDPILSPEINIVCLSVSLFTFIFVCVFVSMCVFCLSPPCPNSVFWCDPILSPEKHLRFVCLLVSYLFVVRLFSLYDISTDKGWIMICDHQSLCTV